MGIQHIRQGHDAFEFVNICPVNDRQDIEMVSAHAFKGQMQRMIRVEVRNLECFHKVFERLFFSPIDKGAPQCLCGQHSQEVVLLGHMPATELAGASLFDHILNMHLGGENLGNLPHDLSHGSLVGSVASAATGLMNAVLMSQCLADRLLLKS